jgi:hypothetical protein
MAADGLADADSLSPAIERLVGHWLGLEMALSALVQNARNQGAW